MVLVVQYIVFFLIVVAMFNEDLVHVFQPLPVIGLSQRVGSYMTGQVHHCVPTHRFMIASNTIPTRYTRVSLLQHRHTRRVLLDSAVVRTCKELGIFSFRGSRGGRQRRVHVIIRRQGILVMTSL